MEDSGGGGGGGEMLLASTRTSLSSFLPFSSMAISWKEMRRIALVLFLGQLLSLLLAMTSFTSSLIARRGVDAPLTQSFFTYLSLSLVYGAISLFRRRKLLAPWYWYAALAIVDVQGNYLAVKAYQYTSITSATLLDCWTIPWVIILTWLVLGTRYSISQFLGAVVCVAGLGLVLLSDAFDSSGGGAKPLLGDVLVIMGTLFYALSNVGEEFFAKKKDRVELLTMLGFFGMLISASQISVFERKELQSVEWSATTIGLFAGFAASTAVFYAVVPLVLKLSGATLFNLSLLTSDMWAIIIRVFFYRQKVDWLYYLAFGVEAIGLLIYSLNDSSTSETDLVEYETLTHDATS